VPPTPSSQTPAPGQPPADPPKKVRSETRRPSIFWFFASIALPILAILARFKIVDGDKLPQQGAYVIAPNHYTEIDPVVVGAVIWRLGRAPRFLAKASLFRIPVLGRMLRRSGQIPVERSGSARGSDPITAAGSLSSTGHTVIIYPEGTLTRDPDLWPMRGKTGAARMALEQNVPVIPIVHWGTQQVMARYAKKISLFPRKTITVKVGDPVDLSEFRGRNLDSATLTAATARIMDALTTLLEELRDEKAPAVRWNPSDHEQKETGRFES
jgi:1-acyl-sn-glycerol-3-phosphate acyltransferase